MKNAVNVLIAGVAGFIVAGYSVVMLECYNVETLKQSNPAISGKTLYRDLLYPCVRITTPTGTGSGVIIATTRSPASAGSGQADYTDNTYILTASHVVGNENVINIEFYNSTVITGTVVFTDTNKDLALLRITNHELRITPARLAPRDYPPYLFTPVWTVGCSLGLKPRPSYGHLCAFAVNYWEVSAPILPGNSGGPVYDAQTHELIGIAVWARTYHGQLITTMAGVVPIQTIYEFLDRKDAENSLCPLCLYGTYLKPAGESVIGALDTNQGDRFVGLTKRPRTTMGRGARKEVNKMPTITSAVELWIPANVPPSPDMGKKWEDVLLTIATLINDRRNAKIPDEAAFQNKLVELSNQAWANVLNPSYRSKSGKTYDMMKNAHDANLQQSYNQWNDKLNRVFESVDGVPAKRFKEIISFAKKFWTETVGKNVLRLTGDRVRGEGAATIAGYWLTGEPKAASMLRPQDTGVIGGPKRICREEFIQPFKAALLGRLVQAGVVIFNSVDSSAIITEQNTSINNLIQGFIDPALGVVPFTPGGASHLDFVKQGALLKLSLQVSQA